MAQPKTFVERLCLGLSGVPRDSIPGGVWFPTEFLFQNLAQSACEVQQKGNK